MCEYRAGDRRLTSAMTLEESGGAAAEISGADYRASDAERDAAIDQLRRHTVEGRLSIQEFDERLDEVLAARTAGQVQAALRELPRLQHASARAASHRFFLPHRVPVMIALLLIIAALASGHVWLLFPLGWLVFGVLRPWASRHDDRNPA